MKRPLHEIATDICITWGQKVSQHALPYLRAMARLRTVQDSYGADDGRSVVLYFLCNAQGFRGPRAKELKNELKEHLA